MHSACPQVLKLKHEGLGRDAIYTKAKDPTVFPSKGKRALNLPAKATIGTRMGSLELECHPQPYALNP